MTIVRLAILVTLGLLLVSVASAQIRYVDEKGVAHWVQTPEQIPPQYRDRATKPALPGADAGIGGEEGRRVRQGIDRENTARWMHETCRKPLPRNASEELQLACRDWIRRNVGDFVDEIRRK